MTMGKKGKGKGKGKGCIAAAVLMFAASGCASFGTLDPALSNKLQELRASLQAADDAMNKVCPAGEVSELCTVVRNASVVAHDKYELAVLLESSGKDAAELLIDIKTGLEALWTSIKTVFGIKSKPVGIVATAAELPPTGAESDLKTPAAFAGAK